MGACVTTESRSLVALAPFRSMPTPSVFSDCLPRRQPSRRAKRCHLRRIPNREAFSRFSFRSPAKKSNSISARQTIVGKEGCGKRRRGRKERWKERWKIKQNKTKQGEARRLARRNTVARADRVDNQSLRGHFSLPGHRARALSVPLRNSPTIPLRQRPPRPTRETV